MTDQSDPNQAQPTSTAQGTSQDFRSQVQRLVQEGKLTAEEAAGLLDDTEQPTRQPSVMQHYVQAVQEGETGENLLLDITAYTLKVVQDSSRTQPELHANEDGRLTLSHTPQGWKVERAPGEKVVGWSSLKAVLTVPFVPHHVKVEINGGALGLADIAGTMTAEVNGGTVTMGAAAALHAEVNGGNLNAGEIHGPSRLEVNGGNLSVTYAEGLNAEVNGGNLRWAGVLQRGRHSTEVNAGNASLTLLPGSSLQVDAEVTVGSFKADFPTQKQGGFLNTRHHGQLGSGEATLKCSVSAGQVKVMTE